MEEGNGEFIIHVLREYDYRFESVVRDEVFDALKACYYYQTKKNLPVYGIPTQSKGFTGKMKDFAQSKKDYEKGRVKIPGKNYRLY